MESFFMIYAFPCNMLRIAILTACGRSSFLGRSLGFIAGKFAA